MLRFILRTRMRFEPSGCEMEMLHTVDNDIAALEDALRSGGQSETGYSVTQLLGVELLDNPTPPEPTRTGGA